MFENFIGLKIAYEKTGKAKPTEYQHTTPTGEASKTVPPGETLTQNAGDVEPTTIDMATVAVSLNSGGSTNEDAGQTIQPPNQSAGKPTDADKTESINYELAERMAVMGEECEPNQTQPYVTDFGVLVIPSSSDPRYHYWKNGGQSVCDTLRELGRCDLIPKYTSPCFNGSKN